MYKKYPPSSNSCSLWTAVQHERKPIVDKVKGEARDAHERQAAYSKLLGLAGQAQNAQVC